MPNGEGGRNLNAPEPSSCVAGPRFTVTLQAVRQGHNMYHVALGLERLGMPEHGHYRLGSKAVYVPPLCNRIRLVEQPA